MQNLLINVKNLEKTFITNANERITALKNINLTVSEGEFISLIGPSGCGKSTLLRIISGLETYDSGELTFTLENKNNGFVFQDSVLFPWKTVYQNVIFPLEIKKQKNASSLAQVDDLIKMVGLEKFRNALPKELSGGMKQRASIARALSYDPTVLMMDEPFGALDAMTRDTLNLELSRIWSESGKTILFVTHDIDEAVFLSTKVVIMSARPGTIKEVIPIDLDKQRDLKIRGSDQFIKYSNYLRGELEH
ncbi:MULTISPECIES: ABC transporter ATP-binding protein [Bacillota]|uniref:ABC transporter ATP-binding protein n=1 Tax=Enterococcus gallinarum TaxID=1353 RepID=A0ABD4ZXT2_ENTGA|nr:MULTISPECIES: ABC transporter ATP-binding protein [Bacillota]MBF0825699.1 ABC transporter ATP-binding protein [Enterococcus faecalis]MBF0724517.1 ABC transporter ATP-binding protein [Enterococcus gallinarum]MBF0799219.1 ABC transporter ATP-binding protein [Enterococcus gallinarum]MBX8979547.1 ABC transporter ATP-binding protein [Enterococcus gallinarum]MCR1929356.1 ABC transporter ATP-binding protein [Enterococcus gallinarum]